MGVPGSEGPPNDMKLALLSRRESPTLKGGPPPMDVKLPVLSRRCDSRLLELVLWEVGSHEYPGKCGTPPMLVGVV